MGSRGMPIGSYRRRNACVDLTLQRCRCDLWAQQKSAFAKSALGLASTDNRNMRTPSRTRVLFPLVASVLQWMYMCEASTFSVPTVITNVNFIAPCLSGKYGNRDVVIEHLNRCTLPC
ncbi:hypothetical protein V5799_003401 [Amblyomma americanum]|uniref:Uncharacterized protein n=1 Tax=Amblyomma americanum TaxID=6943 RepID=A0AAQ4D927_AMBAM